MKFPNIGNTLFLRDILDSSTFDDIFDFKAPPEQKPDNVYSPRQIRGNGPQREGYCQYCEKWYNMKNSSYWYHMNYKHGINCSGKKYPTPKLRERGGSTEGYCPDCGDWVHLGMARKSYRFSWLRHMQRIHGKLKNKR